MSQTAPFHIKKIFMRAHFLQDDYPTPLNECTLLEINTYSRQKVATFDNSFSLPFPLCPTPDLFMIGERECTLRWKISSNKLLLINVYNRSFD